MKTIQLLAAVMICAAIFFGCSKLTQENFNKITTGMDYKAVVELIGEPESCESGLGAKKCIWGSKEENITVSFMGDQVLLTGMHGLD